MGLAKHRVAAAMQVAIVSAIVLSFMVVSPSCEIDRKMPLDNGEQSSLFHGFMSRTGALRSHRSGRDAGVTVDPSILADDPWLETFEG
jgi:hypothetical protein